MTGNIAALLARNAGGVMGELMIGAMIITPADAENKILSITPDSIIPSENGRAGLAVSFGPHHSLITSLSVQYGPKGGDLLEYQRGGAGEYSKLLQDAFNLAKKEQPLAVSALWLKNRATAELVARFLLRLRTCPMVDIQTTGNHRLLELETGDLARLEIPWPASGLNGQILLVVQDRLCPSIGTEPKIRLRLTRFLPEALAVVRELKRAKNSQETRK